MRRLFATMTALIGSAVLLPTANAAIIYEFSGSSNILFLPNDEPFVASFTYTSPDFLLLPSESSQELTVLNGGAMTCAVSNPPGHSCVSVSFATGPGTYDNYLFAMPSGLAGPIFFFEPGAFSQLGTFTVLADGYNFGTLSVSESEPASVPEPASLALLLLGLGGIALSRRRRAP